MEGRNGMEKEVQDGMGGKEKNTLVRKIYEGMV